jgi:beta-lactamase regulating signal transducer with metallopeptidase domain
MSGVPDWGSLATLATLLLGLGWRTFWQAGLMAAVLFLAFRILKRVPAGARMLLWWLVCLKFVLGLALVQPIPLPVLTPAMAIPQSLDSAIVPAAPLAVDAPSQPENWMLALPWLEFAAIALAVLWLAGLTVQAPVLVGQLLRARALRRRAQPVGGEVRQQFDELARQAGLRRIPDLRASNEIHTPHVCGLWRPAVLIPEAALTQWAPAELTMTLGHELVHVRHKDLWYGLVPSVAVRLFFFHPLARLAAREYVLAREAACDARTLSLTGAEPADYAQLLLRFGVTSRTVTAAVAGASPTFHLLKRRLDMLKDSQTQTAPWRWWGAALIVGLVALPFQLTARDVDTSASPLGKTAEASSVAQSQQPEVVREQLLEEARQRQRAAEETELVKVQRERELRRRLEALAMEQAKGQYQQELERTKIQWESAAREYERVTRQQQVQAVLEASAQQRQAEAEAVQRAQEAVNQARKAERAALVHELEQRANLERKLLDTQRVGELEAELASHFAKELEKLVQAFESRKRERAAAESEVDLGTRLRNVEIEMKRLADLLEQLRDQLKTQK